MYSLKWGLKINVNKTKICIFEKKKSRCNFVFSINNVNIDIVDSFCYLGVSFHYNGNMNNAVKCLNDQALRAYNCLLSVFSRVNLDVKTKLSLFGSLVVPIILYGSEVWGAYSFKLIDQLYLRFCKRILGVKSQTSNAAVLGELGRFPLSIIAKERTLKQYLKIMKNSDTLMYKVFNDLKTNENVIVSNSWVLSVRKLLNDLGYGYLWNPDTDFNVNHLPFKTKTKRPICTRMV